MDWFLLFNAEILIYSLILMTEMYWNAHSGYSIKSGMKGELLIINSSCGKTADFV